MGWVRRFVGGQFTARYIGGACVLGSASVPITATKMGDQRYATLARKDS